MWHEARKQERRIRGLIVDYRRRAERRQDFYEKIQADPTQFIQIHGRRCKIYLDPAVAAAGDGSAIIVPWQGQRDNLIDRFDVRAHLDCIPAVTKPSDIEPELSQEERQCNYERYRILAQNDFLNLTEEKFLHQLFLEEQFGANAPLDACQSSQTKKKIQKSGAAIGYSYDDTGNSSISNVIDASQSYSHVKQTGAGATSSKRNENESDSESDSDIDMDVSIEVSKLDTSQAHELNACGRNYGMLSNDFYSYLTKDADEADAMRIAREEEREKMLLSGRKSRRERKAQKERRLARHTFSPPSYAAKEDNTGKDDESESRSPSPSDTAEKITYITSFGGEDELQPHSKITITLGRGSSALGAACVDASTSSSQTSYAQKVKDNVDKFQKSSQQTVRNPHPRSRSKTRSRSRTRTRRSSYRQARRTRSRSQSYHRRRKSDRRSRSRSLSSGRRHYSRQYKSPYKRSRSRSRSKSRSRRRRYTSSLSSRSSRSLSQRRSSRRNRYSPKRRKPSKQCSRSSSVANSFRESIVKEESPKKIQQKVEMLTRSSKEVLKLSPPPIPPSIHPDDEEIKNAAPAVPDVEPPPPLKRYYGRKRGEYSSTSESGSETDDLKLSRLTEATETQEQGEMDTTSETSNPLPSTSAPYKCKPQTGKYGSTTFVSNAPETKMSSSSGSGTGGNVRLNLRERLKKKMQNLLNKQYKADKKAEIEKSERERQQQQERYEEMRELAIKLRRRQREIRHRYGTPNSKASESETSDYAATAYRERQSKSHSSDRSSCKKSSATQRLKSPFSPTKRSRGSPSRPSRHKATMSRSESRSRRSSSRRRRRSISRSERHREHSQEHALSRYVSERSRCSERYRRSRSKSIRDKEKEKHKQYRFRSDRAEDEGRLLSDRHRERERERDHRHRGGRVDGVHQQSSLISATSSSTSASRSRVVISAPPKLKKLVDY